MLASASLSFQTFDCFLSPPLLASSIALSTTSSKHKRSMHKVFSCFPIVAKHETSLEVDVYLRNNMETTITKWKHIFEAIMVNFHSHHHRNKPSKINGGFCMEITRKYMTTKMFQTTMKNTMTCLSKIRFCKDCWETLAECVLSSLTSSWIVNIASTPHIQEISWIQMMMSTMWYFFMIFHHVKIWGRMKNSIVKRP